MMIQPAVIPALSFFLRTFLVLQWIEWEFSATHRRDTPRSYMYVATASTATSLFHTRALRPRIVPLSILPTVSTSHRLSTLKMLLRSRILLRLYPLRARLAIMVVIVLTLTWVGQHYVSQTSVALSSWSQVSWRSRAPILPRLTLIAISTPRHLIYQVENDASYGPGGRRVKSAWNVLSRVSANEVDLAGGAILITGVGGNIGEHVACARVVRVAEP